MKPWPILLALGVIALATGAALVVLQYHHTVGLAAVGLGVVLLLAGVGMAYLGRNAVKVVEKQTVVPPAKRQKGLRKALIAVLVVVIIGVGTFYGTSYLGSIQPGNSFSSLSISSTTSSQTQGGNTTTFSSTPTVILHLFNLVGSNVSTGGDNNVTLTASYINNATAAMPVNFYLATSFTNGTLYSTGFLYFPENNASTVIQPNGPYNLHIILGTFFPAGHYVMTFYVINSTSTQQVSAASEIPFTIVQLS
jgi:hypothetical protein